MMNEDYEVVRANPTAIAALRWVLKAINKDDERMKQIVVEELAVSATNGRQIHRAEAQIDNPFPEGHWVVRAIQKDLVVLEMGLVDPIRNMQIAMSSGQAINIAAGNYRVQASLSSEYLTATLSLGKKLARVDITIQDGPANFEGWLGDEWHLRAIIAPLNLDSKQVRLVCDAQRE